MTQPTIEILHSDDSYTHALFKCDLSNHLYQPRLFWVDIHTIMKDDKTIWIGFDDKHFDLNQVSLTNTYEYVATALIRFTALEVQHRINPDVVKWFHWGESDEDVFSVKFRSYELIDGVNVPVEPVWKKIGTIDSNPFFHDVKKAIMII